MKVKIEWEYVTPEDEEWDCCRALYPYLNPSTAEIGYIGSAFYRSVGQRFADRDKSPLFDFLEAEWELEEVDVIIGHPCFEGRFTKQLLFDTESLLISELNPIGNIQCQKTRITRRGLKVKCVNRWPHPITQFVDNG